MFMTQWKERMILQCQPMGVNIRPGMSLLLDALRELCEKDQLSRI